MVDDKIMEMALEMLGVTEINIFKRNPGKNREPKTKSVKVSIFMIDIDDNGMLPYDDMSLSEAKAIVSKMDIDKFKKDVKTTVIKEYHRWVYDVDYKNPLPDSKVTSNLSYKFDGSTAWVHVENWAKENDGITDLEYTVNKNGSFRFYTAHIG